MDISYERGHAVEWRDDDGREYWLETGKPVKKGETVLCARCGKRATREGHDACIADMAGIANACCGHGVERPYLQFKEDGPVFRLVVGLLQALEEGKKISIDIS